MLCLHMLVISTVTGSHLY